MHTNDGYALLIGVDDYSAFDRARGQELGTHDLPGSRNDARAFWRTCRELGMKPENIRVLVSPPIDHRELDGAGPENVGPATEAEVVAKVGWLLEKLAEPSRPAGLLTWSGHGDVTVADGLVLCPSDVEPRGERELSHAIPFSKINAMIAERGVGDDLTIVLDTCHAGAVQGRKGAGAAGRALSLLGRRASDIADELTVAGAPPERDRIGARVLAAARRGEVAYQSVLDGRYRGVFSWAITTAVEQWKVTQDDSGARFDVSYGKLLETARRLVAALWFDQEPELRGGPAGLADLAVLQRGVVVRPGATSDAPNGRFKTAQLDPGYKDWVVYNVMQGLNQRGKVLVTRNAGGGYDADREYWFLTSNISMGSAVTFTSAASEYWSNPPSGLGTLSFKTERRPSWTSGTPSGTLLCQTVSGTAQKYAINWQMVLSHGTWSGSTTWWSTSTGDMWGESQTNTLSPSSPPSGSWNYFVTSPI